MASPTSPTDLPQSDRADDVVPGHWLLARIGKRVLRPGGLELTREMLAATRLTDADVVELAPGLGRTAEEILGANPRSYTGVDQDPAAVGRVADVIGDRGRCVEGDAAHTGLPEASADAVIGEAMLTMQGERTKAAILAEAVRLLRPGGRYAIHELALQPDDLDPEIAKEIRTALARSIRVNARPLTIAEWKSLMESAGLRVIAVRTAPMRLLSVRRNLHDEGLGGVARILRNVARNPDARRRVLEMRRTFQRYRDALIGVAIIGERPSDDAPAASASAASASAASATAAAESPLPAHDNED